MSDILSKLKPPAGSKREHNRVGRGPGSGNGKTCGRGQKGQGARSGSGGRLYFEGGQMPLQRRVPKRGFRNILGERVVNVNVGQLDTFDNGAVVDTAALKERGLIKGRFDSVKILGNGELTKKLTVKAERFSAGALEKIQKAGGTAEIVSRIEAAQASKEAEAPEAAAEESTEKAAD